MAHQTTVPHFPFNSPHEEPQPVNQMTAPATCENDGSVFHCFLDLPYELRQNVLRQFFSIKGTSPPALRLVPSCYQPSILRPLWHHVSKHIAKNTSTAQIELESGISLTPDEARLWHTLLPPPWTCFPPIFRASKQIAMEAVVPFVIANEWPVASSRQLNYLWKWVSLTDFQRYLRSLTFDPLTNPPKYGPHSDDVVFMNTCRELTCVSAAMSNDPSIMKDGRWSLKPCPVENIIGPTFLKGMLELQYLKYLTFNCRFSKGSSGYQCWEAVKELTDWFVAKFREADKRVEVAARRIDNENVVVDVHAPI